MGIYNARYSYGIWMKSMTKKARPLDSVVLDRKITDELVADVTKFQNSGEWYYSKGVPYRRGYLLYGPPGTGKTSFAQAVAGACKLNLCYINLCQSELSDDNIGRIFTTIPQRSMVLLEDVDAMFN